MRQITESGWQYGTDPIRWHTEHAGEGGFYRELDVDKRRLAKLVDAVQPPTAECPICRRHIGLTPTGRYYRPHTDKARHHCPMSRQEVIT